MTVFHPEQRCDDAPRIPFPIQIYVAILNSIFSDRVTNSWRCKKQNRHTSASLKEYGWQLLNLFHLAIVII